MDTDRNITVITYISAGGYEMTRRAGPHVGEFDTAAWEYAHPGCSVQRTETYLID